MAWRVTDRGNMATLAVLTKEGAKRRRFPMAPVSGQVHFHEGLTWVWYPPELAKNLGDEGLGFWGALIGAVTGLAPLFVGGKKKGVSEAEAQAAVDKARLEEQLIAAQQPRGAEAVFNKKTLPLFALIIFGYLVLR